MTGLTSNPTIFDEAIRNTKACDDAIRLKVKEGKSGEARFFELALENLTQAATLFRPTYEATGGVDGWVSLEVSRLLANDAASMIEEAKQLQARALCSNLYIGIPGTLAGLHAIEESIFAGVPANVTLLFSCEQYVAAADAYWRGIQRRVDAGLDPKVCSVASIFVSRWDKAVKDEIPFPLHNRPGIAIVRQTYRAYRERMAQTAVCNRHHSIAQQFCRWLLLSLDRLESNDLHTTQELIANMLGVRRAGVTETAKKLQDDGIIRYNRGLIEVLNRPALEAQVCECYKVVKRESDRLLAMS